VSWNTYCYVFHCFEIAVSRIEWQTLQNCVHMLTGYESSVILVLVLDVTVPVCVLLSANEVVAYVSIECKSETMLGSATD
jgi:hypothetical protein